MKNLSIEDFEAEWNRTFPHIIPIGYLFKYYFSEHWLLIYSLPSAKRYADNDIELKQLLKHQNQIISECLDSKAEMFIVSGDHSQGNHSIHSIHQHSKLPYDFKIGTPIHLHTSHPIYFDDGEKNDQYFTPRFAQSIWQAKRHNALLAEIANDQTKAFFVSFNKRMIIPPYDGGIDLITTNNKLISQLKHNYFRYLSCREDGL